jgi:hypothetical protein
VRDSSGLADRRCRARRTGDLLSELKRVTLGEEDAPACASRYRNGATQRSHSRDTRAGGGASLHCEAVAHVEAEHTDDWLVHSSGDADTVAVRRSKSDKPRHIVLIEEGAEFFSQHSAERTGGELTFRRTVAYGGKQASRRGRCARPARGRASSQPPRFTSCPTPRPSPP